MESKDREFMSGHNKAAAAAADVNCELTLWLPYHSMPSSIHDDKSNPSTALLLPTLSYTSFVQPQTSLSPSLPVPSLPLSTSPPPKHVPNHSRRSSLASRGGVCTASSSTRPYSVGGLRIRRNPTQAPGKDKSEIIPPPFPWATNLRAIVHNLAYLKDLGITEVPGGCQCKHCEARIVIKHDLVTKFQEVTGYMKERIHLMHDRAPQQWMNPAFPGCAACGQNNCMRPVMADKKRHINWLFLFLGQWLGFCTLEQLKYFCKHTKNHRTGAKDRVLYISYVSLAEQLDPKLSY